MKEINKLVKALGHTQKTFAEAIGMTVDHVKYAARHDSIPLGMMKSIKTTFPNVSGDWLITYEGPMFLDELSSEVIYHFSGDQVDQEMADEIRRLKERVALLEGVKKELLQEIQQMANKP